MHSKSIWVYVFQNKWTSSQEKNAVEEEEEVNETITLNVKNDKKNKFVSGQLDNREVTIVAAQKDNASPIECCLEQMGIAFEWNIWAALRQKIKSRDLVYCKGFRDFDSGSEKLSESRS